MARLSTAGDARRRSGALVLEGRQTSRPFHRSEVPVYRFRVGRLWSGYDVEELVETCSRVLRFGFVFTPIVSIEVIHATVAPPPGVVRVWFWRSQSLAFEL